MPQLRGRARDALPDSAFAYVDSTGRRRLPIHDESHVRNALARFDRVDFEDEAARDKARIRLLRAAKKHGIVPVGFVAGQIGPGRKLPTGRVTLLMTDVEGSTSLVADLGDRYPRLMSEIRRLIRTAVRANGGREVEARADEFFAAFSSAASAVRAAVAVQRAMRQHAWPDGRQIRLHAGVHSGRPTASPTGYVGIAVNTVARVCKRAAGGEVLITRAVRDAIGEEPIPVELRNVGIERLRGIPDPVELWAVAQD